MPSSTLQPVISDPVAKLGLAGSDPTVPGSGEDMGGISGPLGSAASDRDAAIFSPETGGTSNGIGGRTASTYRTPPFQP